MKEDDSNQVDRQLEDNVEGLSEEDQLKLRKLQRVISLVKKPKMKPQSIKSILLKEQEIEALKNRERDAVFNFHGKEVEVREALANSLV